MSENAQVVAHSTLLRRGFLLCADSDTPVAVGEDGICPVHHSGACPIWYVPWADVDPRRNSPLGPREQTP